NAARQDLAGRKTGDSRPQLFGGHEAGHEDTSNSGEVSSSFAGLRPEVPALRAIEARTTLRLALATNEEDVTVEERGQIVAQEKHP
ncbi:hypothetical protein HK405_007533, partial [Cladochytrium tenue]